MSLKKVHVILVEIIVVLNYINFLSLYRNVRSQIIIFMISVTDTCINEKDAYGLSQGK